MSLTVVIVDGLVVVFDMLGVVVTSSLVVGVFDGI